MELTIEDLRILCEKGAINWTAHVLMRLQERNIHPSDIKSCILSGEIIENYPKDYPYPSCLVFGYETSDNILHTVVGVGENSLWIITAYYPNKQKWNSDLRTRKEC